jgi:NADPH:quinone reductase-like Zn-dependent oxidoreductase
MHKIVIPKPGGYERLQYQEFPDPSPKTGEIWVKVEASGVNYADCAIRWGLYESAKRFVGYPITPGFEFAGKVAALGEGVEGFSLGQEVFGVSFFGGYATDICIPAHEVWPKPPQWTMAEAAGFPAVFFTAYHALFQQMRLREGMKILVHSAAGGVGGALLQLGKIAGCEMAGVVGSSHKVEAAKQLGADHVIDKSQEDLWAKAEQIAPEGFDVVLDANGYATLRQSWEHVRPTGRIVIYGFHTMLPKQGGKLNWPKLIWAWLKTPRFNPIDLPNQNRSIISFNLSFLFNRTDLLSEGMEDMRRWIDEGKLQAPRTTCFPLHQVADAHKLIESGRSIGKLILISPSE